ncbi:hypothetical protein BDW69DRAFT_156421, partial [Aspergillus filifer]
MPPSSTNNTNTSCPFHHATNYLPIPSYTPLVIPLILLAQFTCLFGSIPTLTSQEHRLIPPAMTGGSSRPFICLVLSLCMGLRRSPYVVLDSVV